MRLFLLSASGSMTIPAIVFFVVCMALGGMAVDLQRVYGAHSQMQAYVDDVALAAAAELDGQSGAITRSIDAACGAPCGVGSANGPLVRGTANQLKFATDNSVAVERVIFFSAITTDPGPLGVTPVPGPNGDTVICIWQDGGWATACPNGADQSAKFVEVRAESRTITYYVLPIANFFTTIFGQGNLQAQLQLKATAGFKRAVCNALPMMVCNPYEASLGAGAAFNPLPGQQIFAKAQGGSGASWTPGNFGLLNNYPGNGDSALEQSLARVDPNTACTLDNVQIKTGQGTGPVGSGINVRMDQFDTNLQSKENDPEYAPAPVVTKGLKPGNGMNGACNPSLSSLTMPLPRDNCFMTAVPSADGTAGTGCTNYGGTARLGDGQWARSAYWSQNHPSDPQPTGYIDATSPIGGMSRYDVYRYEITHPVNRDEQSAPACSSVTPNTDVNHDRRILYMAVVDCLGDASSISNNNPIPVKAYAKVFLTEPVGNTAWSGISRNGATWGTTANADIYVEIVGIVKPNDQSGLVHVYPVLYR